MKSIYPIFILSLLLISACNRSKKDKNPSTEDKASLKVYILDGGYLDIRDLSNFTQDSSYDGMSKKYVNPVFLIEHENGRLIWELGNPDELADRKPLRCGDYPDSVFYVTEKLITQLSNMKLSPDSIDYVAVSHTHLDHIGNANYFLKSQWIVDKKEYEWAMGEERKDHICYYDSLLTTKHIVFEEKYDVFRDGSVYILTMPGHTPGHMCLLINLKDQPLLLSGGLYDFIEQRKYKRVPKFNTDVDMTLRSMDKFETLVDSLHARVIIQHEKAHFEQLPSFPNYLE